MNDFDEVQERAQEMTSGVTDASPAHEVTVSEPSDTGNSFSYAGYGEREKEKTKTSGRTLVVDNPTPDMFATPYRGGGSYPGAVVYGAEAHPDPTVATLKSKFSPVQPYTLAFRGMTGQVDTLNMRKALVELMDHSVPYDVNAGFWSGYDMQLEPPHEDFVHGLASNLWNWIPSTLSPVLVGVPGDIISYATKAYGRFFNDQDAIRWANNAQKLTEKWTDDIASSLNWDYSDNDANAKRNQSGAIFGNILGSMGVNIFGGIRAALTLASAEGIANGYFARRMAQDRGVSTLGSLGIGAAAGAATFVLGASSKGVEGIARSALTPAVGWGITLKNAPKSFVIRKAGEKSITGIYDAATESAQDLVTNALGNGELTGADWEQAWLTFVYGAAVAGMFTAVAVHADKKTQAKRNEYTETIVKYFDTNKELLDKIKEGSHGLITDETINAYREQLLSGEAREGFVDFVKNRVAENIDRLDSLPDEMKTRLKDLVAAGDGATPLADEVDQLDANIDAMLENVTGLSDSSKQMAREFLRGMAFNSYVYNNIAPSKFGLPTIVADIEPGQSTYYDKATKEVHVLREDTANKTDLYPLSPKSGVVPVGEGAATSAKVKQEAITAAQTSEDATLDKSRGRALMAHELWHWVEDATGLPNSVEFVQRMTDWANTVLPDLMVNKSSESVVVVGPSRTMLDTSTELGPTEKVEYEKKTPKEGLERSEGYAYALQYAKSLKGPLGLVGDVRAYMELFNSISQINNVAEKFEAYNKMLSQTIKQNAAIVDDLLKAYPDLRQNLKHYVETGNVGMMKKEDLAKLREVLMSVIDSKTADKLTTALGDVTVIKTFMDRYEKEYEASEKADAARVSKIKRAIYDESQKRTKAIDDMGLDLQKTLQRQAMEPLALPAPEKTGPAAIAAPEQPKLLDNDRIKEAKKNGLSTEAELDAMEQDARDAYWETHDIDEGYVSPEETEQLRASNEEEPPFRQYSGEQVPLARDREKAQWIERWRSGEKLTPEQHEGLKKKFTEDVIKLIGFLPKKVGKYHARQNMSSNKPQGVETAIWEPTAADLKKMGVSMSAKDLKKANQLGVDVTGLTSDQLAAVGRWSAIQDVKKVYSIADDITAITGLDGQGVEGLVLDTTGNSQAEEFVDEVQDIVQRLRNMSEDLNHSGDKLGSEDINREMPLLEEALKLVKYDASGIEDEQAREAITRFQGQIDVDALEERIQDLSYQKYLLETPEDKAKSVAYLPNPDPFGIKYVPTGWWSSSTREEKVPVGSRPINSARKYGTTDLAYWIDRAGLDTDKFPSVEAIESYIRERGLEPISFDVDAVVINNRGDIVQIPAFLKSSSLVPEKISPLYARNEPVTVDFDADALLKIGDGHPTMDALVNRLLSQAWAQLPRNLNNLSLDQKLIEFAAIGRAQMIAEYVFSQYNSLRQNFAEWATIGPSGDTIKGADIDFVNSKNGKPYVAKLNNKYTDKNPYILRNDLNPRKLPVGLQFLATYSNGFREAVITQAGLRTKDSNRPFYVVRFNFGGHVYDMVWDYGEFELLQKNEALFARPDLMRGKELERYASDGNFDFTMEVADTVNPNEKVSKFIESPKNYTSMVQDAKKRKQRTLYIAGESEYDPSSNELNTDVNLTSKVFSVADDADYILDATDVINVNDPFPYLSNEQFENVDPIRQKAITGNEASNKEVYQKMKDAEVANKKKMSDYLGKKVLPTVFGGKKETIEYLINKVENNKHHPMVGMLTLGGGVPGQIEYIFGKDVADAMGLTMDAEKAERLTEKYRRDIEKALLARTFKNQGELNKWSIKSSVDIHDVKAEIFDKGEGKYKEKAISKDEIMSLYLAEITKKGTYVSKTGQVITLPVINGGFIEENGNTYIYNRLRQKYRNFDQLVGLLTEQDKQAAEILTYHLYRSSVTVAGFENGDFFIPVNTHKDYEIDGWSSRRRHNSAVFGTRLLDPDAELVVTGAFATANNMAATAGVRTHNYIEKLQELSDLLNMGALEDEKVRVDRGFRADFDDTLREKEKLTEAVEASRRLNEAIYKSVGSRVAKEFKNAIADAITNDNGTEVWSGFKWMQKLTRTASAMALSLKPLQAATNLVGNYMIMGGLSSHGALWYNTVGLSDAILHGVTAWKDMKNNKAFMHRLEQSALSEQYKRAIEHDDSFLQELGKLSASMGKGKTADIIAVADAIAKWSTKWGVGLTNTYFDLLGLAMGRWVVKGDVLKNVTAEWEAEFKRGAAGDFGASSQKFAKIIKESGPNLSEADKQKRLEEVAEEEIANYMFSHISSSNIMARGHFSKSLSRIGLEGLAAFKNDMLQKAAAFANAYNRLVNSKDSSTRTQAWRELEAITLSNLSYVAIRAGLVYAAIRALSGDDLDDKEKEYVMTSLTREMLGQVADLTPGSAITQQIMESLILGKEGGSDFIPVSDAKRFARNLRKGDFTAAGAQAGGLIGFSPAERAVQMTRAFMMAFGDDERAAAVGRLMLAGRSESTAKNMLGYTTNKAGKIVPKKSNKKKD